MEAKKDAAAGRYADALARHLWFHHNALKYDRSFSGVRLSFALGYWSDLAKQYPPALDALKTTRNAGAARVRAGTGNRDDFHDVSSIDEYLDDVPTTTELFVWLDVNNPALAKASYGVAQRALVESKNYQLCGKYLDPPLSTKIMLEIYRENQRLAKKKTFDHMKDFGDKSLTNQASTLVALLVLNNRSAEADQVVAAVLKERSDKALRDALDKAKKGIVPEPWPSRFE
jgi:hypothetical protein